MALPADFSKIYGSTATGGLTPISDVNYAKGWEFVGATPPTKNDFSYLQNLSDLKSQWLYSNKLQRANPFGDIKSDGESAVAAALSNLGLGTAAKRNVNATTINGIPDMSSFRGLMLANGYVQLPIIGAGGGAQTLIIQWGILSTAPASNALYNLNVSFPTSILWATGGRGAPGSNASMGVSPEGTQQIRIQNYAPSGPNENCLWIAIGY